MPNFFSPKDTLILANGEKPSLNLFKKYFDQKKRLIALDGASSWLYTNGFKPDLIIGDMDSLEKHVTGPLVTISDQESNDLEKALKYCEEAGFLKISLLGAFGLRADHFL